jgi:two-component system KDP operon response regulator KdpE
MSAETGRRVLAVDDELLILRGLKLVLREAGFEPVAAATATEALDLVALRPPDAAIIDLVLPDGDGVEICREIRTWSQMPLIVLSALDDEDHKVRALEAGADDYVTKPFSPRELIARLEAALRRAPGAPTEPVVDFDGLSVDLNSHTVTVDGEEVRLTPTEFGLLRQFAQNPGRLLTHRHLLVEVWGPGYADDTQVLRTHIANLRRKIEPEGSPKRIRTDTGIGYRFNA